MTSFLHPDICLSFDNFSPLCDIYENRSRLRELTLVLLYNSTGVSSIYCIAFKRTLLESVLQVALANEYNCQDIFLATYSKVSIIRPLIETLEYLFNHWNCSAEILKQC